MLIAKGNRFIDRLEQQTIVLYLVFEIREASYINYRSHRVFVHNIGVGCDFRLVQTVNDAVLLGVVQFGTRNVGIHYKLLFR